MITGWETAGLVALMFVGAGLGIVALAVCVRIARMLVERRLVTALRERIRAGDEHERLLQHEVDFWRQRAAEGGRPVPPVPPAPQPMRTQRW